MNILIAPDAFKDSLSAKAVASHIAKGIKKVLPDAKLTQIPLSDGGEGLLEALVTPLKGELITVKVNDPLMRPIEASYGILGDGQTAVIELAAASGLERLHPNERNPLVTSTYGTGQLVQHALDRGCKKLIIGLGGSATNDAGMGLVKALGGQFLNSQGKPIGQGGGALADLDCIDLSQLDNRLADCKVIAACDVTNPLTGPQGASHVFGRQKGGQSQDLEQLDSNLSHLATIIQTQLGKSVQTIKGTGAAGGTAMGLLTFTNAELKPGIELIMDELQMENHIKKTDLIITGEGRIDQQTLYGKTLIGVTKKAKHHRIPVIAIAGQVETDLKAVYKCGLTAAFAIVNQPMHLGEAIENTGILIESTVENIFRTLGIKLL
ncbi:glycerate kinase [Mesohalobacter halotolerans]|uniref:Glycerate kinase n=1 Tax=Mesohalobacter halotolerans TaxID=1883405 RepID=A0A4U5TSR4_9FLAO|nr:glycerate kinase [Mesohalobacter halotolerans]TKS56484.1 glycerate kinase [Mesohalobacter halotolerans]